MTRRALLVMDLQVGVCGPDGSLGRRSGASAQTAERGVLGRTAEALRRARAGDDLVVHVRVAFDEHGLGRVNRTPAFAALQAGGVLAASSPEAAFCPEVVPAAGEPVVTKGCVSPFAGTGLDDLLRAHGVDHLLLAGVATNFVVESAARHAGDAGYRVAVVEDLCAAHTAEMHRFAIEKTLPMFAAITALDAVYPAS